MVVCWNGCPVKADEDAKLGNGLSTVSQWVAEVGGGSYAYLTIGKRGGEFSTAKILFRVVMMRCFEAKRSQRTNNDALQSKSDGLYCFMRPVVFKSYAR